MLINKLSIKKRYLKSFPQKFHLEKKILKYPFCFKNKISRFEKFTKNEFSKMEFQKKFPRGKATEATV